MPLESSPSLSWIGYLPNWLLEIADKDCNDNESIEALVICPKNSIAGLPIPVRLCKYKNIKTYYLAFSLVSKENFILSLSQGEVIE